MPEEFLEDTANKENEDDFLEERRVSSKKKSVSKPRQMGYSGELLTNDISTSKKRRVSSTDINKDGPIMKTKRKRLVSVESDDISTPIDEKPVIKKKTVKQNTEEIIPKKRTVKKSEVVEQEIETHSEVAEESPENKPESSEVDTKVRTKRRKPVRRKSSKNDLPINEDVMQENLLDDFTKE